MPIAVGEERLVAIPQLLHDLPSTEVIILDDAFQHRSVSAGLNILLTDHNNLFSRDWYLPTGDLRDMPRSYKRADIIVVTKCPYEIDKAEKEEITNELHVLPDQEIFFSAIKYGTPYHLVNKNEKALSDKTEVLLLTGIANPRSLKKFVFENYSTYYQSSYNDHHIYTIDDLREIIKRFSNISAKDKIILTTEKDAVRLSKFNNEIADLPFYVIPVEPEFLFGEGEAFTTLIANFITGFNRNGADLENINKTPGIEKIMIKLNRLTFKIGTDFKICDSELVNRCVQNKKYKSAMQERSIGNKCGKQKN